MCFKPEHLEDDHDQQAEHKPTNLLLVTNLVDELVISVVNSRIYWHDHPRVQNALQDVKHLLDSYLELSGEASLKLGVVDDCLVLEGRPLLGATLSAPRIIEPLKSFGASGLELGRNVDLVQLRCLMDMLVAGPEEETDCERANQILDQAGCRTIRFLTTQEDFGRAHAARISSIGSEIAVPVRVYQNVVNLLQSLTINVCRGTSFSMDQARTHVSSVLTHLEENSKSMMNVVRYEKYDAFTFGHSIRVCYLAANFARALTTNTAAIRRVALSALLHDVGKARIPFELLHAKHRLSVEERREMEKHTTFGAEILSECDDPDPIAIAAAFGHHKTNNYQGYPRTLHTNKQSKVTKIVKVCDVYEALTAVRPYKPSMEPLRAFRIMLSMRNHFDQRLLRRFIEVTGVYPDGQYVQLNTGELARVERQTADLVSPVVQVLTTPEGDELAERDQPIFDLSREDDVCVAQLIASHESELVEA